MRISCRASVQTCTYVSMSTALIPKVLQALFRIGCVGNKASFGHGFETSPIRSTEKVDRKPRRRHGRIKVDRFGIFFFHPYFYTRPSARFLLYSHYYLADASLRRLFLAAPGRRHRDQERDANSNGLRTLSTVRPFDRTSAERQRYCETKRTNAREKSNLFPISGRASKLPNCPRVIRHLTTMME